MLAKNCICFQGNLNWIGMLKLNSILKIVIVVFLSLVIPSFLSIFKISFDEYIAAQGADVQGASVVRVQTVSNKTPQGDRERTVVLDFSLPRMGAINNQSQRAFKFPKPRQQDTTLVNKTPLSYTTDPTSFPVTKYTIIEDSGRGPQEFYFAYAGVLGDSISFVNNNNYDMLDVRIKVNWIDGNNNYTSVYTVFEIQHGQKFTHNRSNTAEASIPFNPTKTIKSIEVQFKDNSGSSFSAFI